MPPTKPPAPRKRNRKRKRRLASSSSSSDSSSSDSSSDETPNKTTTKKAPLKKQATLSSVEEPSSPSSSSSSSPSSSDSEDDDAIHESKVLPTVPQAPFVKSQGSERVRARSPSPSPPPVDLPSFLPAEGSSNRAQEEQALRDRFRQFWMASVADAFSDDLEQIRKVRHLLAYSSAFYPVAHHARPEGAEYDQIALGSAD
jgi:ribosome assembly protein 3